MSFLDVYISYWQDAIDAAEDGREIGTPYRRSEFFHPGRLAFKLFHDKCQSGELDAVQTDWAGWVARVTKAQIVSFEREVLDLDRNSHPGSLLDKPGFEHLVREHDALVKFINGLDDESSYALVAVEL